MLKGGRFIWYFWTKVFKIETRETETNFEFTGKVSSFPELGNQLWHQRRLVKYKDIPRWEVIDTTNYEGPLPLEQHWNIFPEYSDTVSIKSFSENNNEIQPSYVNGWYSVLYGQKSAFQQKVFSTGENYLKTIIELN